MTQYATPILVSPDGTIERLTRVSFDAGASESAYDEDWLQRLLHSYPETLPTGDIDRSFDALVPVCRELPTPAGPVDLLFVTRDGGIAIVETKLWRNPESRRKVIAQILDYAKELADWNYDDLCSAIATATGRKHHTLYDLVVAKHPGLDEQRFIDSVGRNLAQGRFLLVIAGDGIRDGVENLTAFLDRLGRLEFTFGLVEVGVYRTTDGRTLVQPRVLAKTMIVRRTVVTVVSDRPVRVQEEGDESAIDPADAQDNDIARFYTAFWTDFLGSHLQLDDKSQPMASPSRSTNIYFPQPPSGSQAWISAYFMQSARRVGVYLRFAKGEYGQAAYEQLLADRAQIDKELGMEAAWELKDGKPSISVRHPYGDLRNPEDLAAIRRFFADAINRFVGAFRPRLERIAQEL